MSAIQRQALLRSYAQNHEDIVLRRVLRDVPRGRYVEVGANHPTIKSVSYLFYRLGWRGALIEPQPDLCDLLHRVRPGDEVFQCVAYESTVDTMRLYEVPQATRSTLVKEVADAYGDWRSEHVSARTLNDILDSLTWASDEIHFMTIDVEGAEPEVLKGLDLTRFRPWVLVVESVHPVTLNDTSSSWARILEDNGYTDACFDGVSRYYVAAEHSNLIPRCYPACSTDQFIPDFP